MARAILLPVCLFAALLGLFFWGLQGVSQSAGQEALRSTEESIRRAAVHCYAVEGAYPQSLSYLKEHYGVQVSDDYIVHYESFASNLMPDISVYPKHPDAG
ncbi:hypothetical protein H8709_11130 [Oscillospiraceae bacterium NSJ-54]|uniref:Uncharacterized protein n=2 Tax=Zongyangia hominis TaxID=2763677 RepID=A0A926EF78_9FIRM|nr:hypothetical protein [Zongyangia hominis]